MEVKVEKWIQKIPVPKQGVVLKLRSIILSTSEMMAENIKWGNLCYSMGNSNIILIYTYPTTDYINLGFLHATSLVDDNHLFEGSGKGMRHVKIRKMKDIPTVQVKKWINESIQLIVRDNH